MFPGTVGHTHSERVRVWIIGNDQHVSISHNLPFVSPPVTAEFVTTASPNQNPSDNSEFPGNRESRAAGWWLGKPSGNVVTTERCM